MNVFVFGGSFNPPHMSHVLAVTYLLAAAEPDQVLVVPCFQHPLAKGLAPFEDRVAMCERAMGWLPRTVVSRVEGELGGESRSLRTVAHLRATHPDWNLRLVVGADILLEAERWHAFDQVKALAPLFVLGRAGFQAEGAPSRCSPSSRAAPCVLFCTGRNGTRSPVSFRCVSSRTSESMGSTKMAELDIAIVGAGKVGGALTKALRERGATVHLRAARKGLPRAPFDADLLVLAVRDGQLPALVAELLAKKGVTRKTNVVHCAGALGPEPLEPLRAICAGVADAPRDLVCQPQAGALVGAGSGSCGR